MPPRPRPPRGLSDLQSAAWLSQRWGQRAAAAAASPITLDAVHGGIRADVAALREAGSEVGHTAFGKVMHMLKKGRRGGERVRWWYSQMLRAGVRPGPPIYKVLLQAEYGNKQAGLENLRKTWAMLCEKNPRPSAPLRNIYLRGLVEAGAMKEARAFYDALPEEEKTMVFRTTMIAGLPPEEARACFEGIAETPDYLAYRALLFSYCKAEQYSAAERVLEDMRGRGVRYDVVAYHHLMRAAPTAAAVVDLWERCVRDGLRHNTVSFDVLLAQLARHAVHPDDSYACAAARAFFDEMPRAGVERSYRTCKAMLQLCAKVGDPDTAERVRSLEVAQGGKTSSQLTLVAYRVASDREDDPTTAPIFTPKDARLDAFMR